MAIPCNYYYLSEITLLMHNTIVFYPLTNVIHSTTVIARFHWQ